MTAAATTANSNLPRQRLQSAIIPSHSPLHAQANTSSLTLSPARSPRLPPPSRPLSSTPNAAGGAGDGDPLGLKRRRGTRPARPSSLGSFMSLPGHQRPTDAAQDEDANVEAEEEEEEEEEREDGWTVIDRLRLWRDDACTQHLYDTAVFWGGKVWLMTGDANDAFWLAQVYFLTGQFARAEKVLTGVRRRPSPTSASGGGDLTTHDPGRSFASVFNDEPPPPPPPTTTTRAAEGGREEEVVRLTDFSVACRYLAAQCMVRQSKWSEALSLLGDVNPFRPVSSTATKGKAREEAGATDGGIKFEASMCHLRGIVHLHHKATERAKECFMEALALDVKSYESFEALVGGNMLEPEEEWEFVQSLAYVAQTPADASLVRSVYTSRLSKTASHLAQIEASLQTLRDEYGMRDDPDVMFGLADFLFSAWRWADCYRVTSRILALHDFHKPTLPLHLTCMYHLGHTHSALFVLAHEIVDREPDSAVGWYGAGVWYFAQGRWDECRRFFSKAAMMENRFAPAWFGFGHSLALEGEHDQAITAYSTAQHNFQGTHLPLLFIGMQHLVLANTKLASEYLDAAWGMCREDPLVLNERGVVAYYEDRFEDAVKLFEEAVEVAQKVQCAESAWSPTFLNLCHCRRQLGRFEEAVEVGMRAKALDPRSSATLTAIGMALHGMDRTQLAIEYYHQSLAIHPADPVTTDLLASALERHAFLDVGQSPGTSFHYPGLPFAVGYTLDNEVDADDGEVGGFGSSGAEKRKVRRDAPVADPAGDEEVQQDEGEGEGGGQDEEEEEEEDEEEEDGSAMVMDE